MNEEIAKTVIKRFSFHRLEVGKHNFVLPFGFPIRNHDVVEWNSTQVWVRRSSEAIKTTSGNIVVPESRALLFPYFTECTRLKDGRELTIQPVLTLNELLACQQLTHYLSWPQGMYLCGKIKEMVVGALVLSRLSYHMRPAWRRELEEERDRYIEALWVRRIAVAEDFQKIGVGGCLAKAAVSIGDGYWIPRPQIVELIAQNSNHQFLIGNGYKLEHQGRPGYLSIVANGLTEKKRLKRYYYWCEVPADE